MSAPSSLEAHIITILKKEKIPFLREKTFPALRQGRLRFDFYFIYNEEKILLEVDGQAHFISNPKFYKKPADFRAARNRDRRKNLYAMANGISLYRIPFWEVFNIHSIEDILNPAFYVRDEYHNDYLIEKAKEMNKK